MLIGVLHHPAPERVVIQLIRLHRRSGPGASIGDQLHPRGKLDAAVYRRIGEVYEAVEKREQWVEGSTTTAEIGVITSSGARYFLRQMVEPSLPNLFFLAHNEVPPGVRVQSLGNIQ